MTSECMDERERRIRADLGAKLHLGREADFYKIYKAGPMPEE